MDLGIRPQLVFSDCHQTYNLAHCTIAVLTREDIFRHRKTRAVTQQWRVEAREQPRQGLQPSCSFVWHNISLTLKLQMFLSEAPASHTHTPYRVLVALWSYNISLVLQLSTHFRPGHELAHVLRESGCIFSAVMAVVLHQCVPMEPPHFPASSVSVTAAVCHSSWASSRTLTMTGHHPTYPCLLPPMVMGESPPFPDTHCCVFRWSYCASSTMIPGHYWTSRHRWCRSRPRRLRCSTCLCRSWGGSYPCLPGTRWSRSQCPSPMSVGDTPRARPDDWTQPCLQDTVAGRSVGCGWKAGKGRPCTPENKHQGTVISLVFKFRLPYSLTAALKSDYLFLFASYRSLPQDILRKCNIQ